MGFETSFTAASEAVSLFDGKTLTNWEGDAKLWRVEDGLITGGSLTEKVTHNDFIATTKSFHNFDLRVKLKLTGTEGFINSGVQIRSLRVPGSSEMSGYQVDYGKGWYGKLYDESRRNKVIAESANLPAATAAIKEGDWNEYRIRAEGPRIQSWINGVPALDYTEADPNIAQDGHIGVQVHGGGKALVQVKDVSIEELPPTPNAPTWEKVGKPKGREPKGKAAPNGASTKATPKGRDISYNTITEGPKTPEEQRQSFTLPAGFEIELVAGESDGIGKFITVVWDARGRMWTMTALEYPVDGNENAEASRQLFAKGGRDKVLVFDPAVAADVNPRLTAETSDRKNSRVPTGAATGILKPRVFADGLVMPLGLLPYKDGALVQYGGDIRFYRDTDGDGRADKHEVVLTGFGTQDSHLFPHQFMRAPGGWFYAAQGLFNYSNVRRPDGKPFADGALEIPFNQCKLARFTSDGTKFENLTAGPNNIWGLVIDREGETFLQEANDLGCPVVPFEPGAWYRTGSPDRLRPYQPLMPPTLMPPQMGGTGLSGLALAEDRDSPFQRAAGVSPAELTSNPRSNEVRTAGSMPAARLFYLANPITSTVQIVKAAPDGVRYRYEKLPDFVTTTDRWFRPVAVHFGPDGCLYIVDWYNKIISHNEVPRTHPDRDKTRGRIWRVRHKDQPRTIPPDLTKLDERALPAQLGGPNALVSRLAWQEIIDRKASGLVPELERIAADKAVAADRRLGALWALEGLKPVTTALLQLLAADSNPNIRHEAVRIAAAQPRPEADFLAVAERLPDDPDPKVRAALGDALRRVVDPSPSVIALAARLGREPLPNATTDWPAYDRAFERYLARWAMELHPKVVAAFLASPAAHSLPLENRLLATLALGSKDAAIGLARLMPEMPRPLGEEEVRVLASHFAESAVADALQSALKSPVSQAPTLRALLNLRTGLDTTKLNRAVADAAQALWQRDASDAGRQFVLQVAGAFQVAALERDIAGLAAAAGTKAELKLAALRTLRELGTTEVETLAGIIKEARSSPALRNEAIAALAASKSSRASALLLELWPSFDVTARGTAAERLSATRPGAEALLASIRAGKVAREEVGLSALEKMHTLLPGHPPMEELWREFAGRLQRVLRLNGGTDDFAATGIELKGPFTVEAWVKLDAGISNQDGILAAPRQFDMNFHAGQFRVWVGGGQHDIVVAKRKTTADSWTHYAATRDASGVFRIYFNGELDATSTVRNTNTFTGLDVGRTTPANGGTAGWLAEFRVWNTARTPQEIRDNFDRSFAGEPKPTGLAHYLTGDSWGKLSGRARVEPTIEAPALLTAAEVKSRQEKFAQFRALAEKRGNAQQGRELFTTICLTCHQVRGQGGQIAPPLDGVGITGTEALLRNILTPNAAMEGGYRKFRIETKDDELLEGFLVSQDAAAIVLRQPNLADQRIPRSNVKRAAFTTMSVMPEGLLEGMTPAQVSDLFAFLLSLK